MVVLLCKMCPCQAHAAHKNLRIRLTFFFIASWDDDEEGIIYVDNVYVGVLGSHPSPADNCC